MATASELITAYLAATRWTKGELARRAGISASVVARLINGRKANGGVSFSVGELAALKIERATGEAYASGVTKIEPLRAVDLLATNTKKSEAA